MSYDTADERSENCTTLKMKGGDGYTHTEEKKLKLVV